MVREQGASEVMQFKNLNEKERAIKRWRERRNRLVSDLLAKDKWLPRVEALRKANAIMRKRGDRKP